DGWHIFEITGGLALGATGLTLVMGRAPAYRTVQLVLVFALWVWMLVSTIFGAHGDRDSLDAVLGFGKGSVAAFVLVALNTTTMRRLQIVSMLLTLLCVIVAGQSIVEYRRGLAEDRGLDSSQGGSGEPTQPTQELTPTKEWDDSKGPSPPPKAFVD